MWLAQTPLQGVVRRRIIRHIAGLGKGPGMAGYRGAVSRCTRPSWVDPLFWGGRQVAGKSCFPRDLPAAHEYLRAGQDCANLGRVPFARRPTGTGHSPPHGLCGDWPSLGQWACSPANGSRQRHCNCRQNSWLYSSQLTHLTRIRIWGIIAPWERAQRRWHVVQVELHTPAPDFEPADFRGNPVRLSRFRGDWHVFLVFNRGFM